MQLWAFLYLYEYNFIEADMKNPIQIKTYVEGILKTCTLAVLATEANGQPCASLMAITPFKGFRQILFATYRNTQKFENIINNSRVAVLIQGEEQDRSNLQKGFALTAYGHAHEVGKSELEEAVHSHLKRHPNLESFLHSGDIAILRIKVETYQVVRGIDDVVWWPVTDTDEPKFS